MHLKRIFHLAIFTLILSLTSCSNKITKLQDWLALNPANRPSLETLKFSKKSLTKTEATTAQGLLLEDKKNRMLSKYGIQWDNRLLSYGDYKMPFYYQIFGEKPADGRSLFISLHGGGNTEASVNDQQYKNQQHLYDKTMQSLEGVYLAPRAPTNTWNLWHENHIDDFLNIIIQMAVIKEQVNPNKVYILGYSAGGDGLYQLAPRMADRWAAASMMAGHPGDASIKVLRNLPFAIHVGALDKAYNRNKLAEEWGNKLDSLQTEDPEGYRHFVQVHKGKGHWMNFEDAVALPWMKKFQRNPIPDKVIWIQDDRHHSSFYWIETPENEIKTGGEIIATYNKTSNEINILKNYSKTVKLLLNDKMLDLDKPITIKYQNNIIYKGVFKRFILNIYKNLEYKGDVNFAFPTSISVENNTKVTQENFVLK